jgi:hypothetical protein
MGLKDVDGDSRTDVFWFNVNTGGVSAWLISGSNILDSVGYGAYARNTGWIPIGLKDFNDDGRTDLLWYNAYTGGIVAWFLNADSQPQIVSYGQYAPNSGWTPLGARDVNGDGCADVFWYNRNTGSIVAWFINGSARLAQVSYLAVPPTSGWVPAGLADFNGDGRTDLLWYNAYTGGIIAWLLRGSSILQEAHYGTNTPNSGWTPLGIEDVSGDGRADLLWYHTYTGQVRAWLINGGSVSKDVPYGTLNPTAGWAPIGLDDFNGDGRIDLLWYNRFTNATTTWLLYGSGILRKPNYGAVPASSVWRIQVPRD